MTLMCEMCGAVLQIKSGVDSVVCEYCGVARVVSKSEGKMVETVLQTANGSAESLTDRAFILLEHSDFAKANELLEQALNIDPRYAKAYVGQLLVMCQLNIESQLVDCDLILEEQPLFKKASQFASENYRIMLMGYATSNRNDALLKEAIQKAKGRPRKLDEAISILEQIPGYKNADELLAWCEEGRNAKYEEAKRHIANNNPEIAIAILGRMKNYQDAPELIKQARELVMAKQKRKNKIALTIVAIVFILMIIATLANYEAPNYDSGNIISTYYNT
ncbi:MAG: hypothetical protein FWD03_06600 [Defluviitaleaceae bacterium]|nr:hypothetical protein [Defluviitaleaceae bacterium]